jgi:hypothetical protein
MAREDKKDSPPSCYKQYISEAMLYTHLKEVHKVFMPGNDRTIRMSTS